MKLRIVAQYIPKDKKAPTNRLTTPVQLKPKKDKTIPAIEKLTEDEEPPKLEEEKPETAPPKKKRPKKRVEPPTAPETTPVPPKSVEPPAKVKEEPIAVEKALEDKLPAEPTIEDVPEETPKKKTKDILEPTQTPPTVSTPALDIDISSPAQAALSMSTIIDSLISGAADVLQKVQQIPESTFKTNPAKARKQVEQLVDALNSQIVQLREVSDAFGSQVQAV